ncbi:MAG: acyl carrier protein phosphodiesterase [Bacteroidetes bacterium]|nr:acyl carrier protein phosphodiesterase [Bacteroidota bacterium]
MISDYVKGNKRYTFPIEIQKGIILHRRIDAFTDTDNQVKKIKEVFKPAVGAYCGAFLDIAYDHFLAKEILKSKTVKLHQFVENIYTTLTISYDILPERFKTMLPSMISYNWLENYQYQTGIEKSFTGIEMRAKFLERKTGAYDIFLKNYHLIQHGFHEFFPRLHTFAFREYEILNKE